MRRLLALTIALVTAFSLIGCSAPAKDVSSNAQTNTIETETTVAETEEAEEATTDSDRRLNISVLARGKGTGFWSEIEKGIDDAAKDYDVDYTYHTPDTEIASFQLSRLMKSEIEKMPDAIVISPIGYDDIYAQLKKSAKKGIPVVAFDSGKRDDVTGATVATSGIDNYEAGKEAADLLFSDKEILSKLSSATMEEPVFIGCLSQDALTESIIARTSGFVDEAFKICSEHAETCIEGHEIWAKANDDACIYIEIAISEAVNDEALAYSAEVLCRLNNILGIFATGEPCVNALIDYKASDGEYHDTLNHIPVYGFDAGEKQRKAVKDGFIKASFGQDAYSVGYKAMELAVKAAKNEEVDNEVLPYIRYDASNIDDSSVVKVLFK